MSKETPNALLEFGGAPGNLVLIVALPLITAWFWFAVAFNGGQVLPGPEADFTGFLQSLQPTPTAVLFYLGWFAWQAALQAWGPGAVVDGTELPQGGRLQYKVNGPFALGATFVAAGVLVAVGVPATLLHDQFGALITVMTSFTVIFSLFLYAYGKRHGQARHLSGNPIRDFFMGTGHNPRLPHDGLFDLKFFCEARPGLILWVLIDLSMAAAQLRDHGEISVAMALVCLFQAIYVLDYYAHERAILTTMDIKHENFGYMLAFGDLVWVPMTYSLQAAYCVNYSPTLSWPVAALLFAMNLGGLAIFRSVNNQKNSFRNDPTGALIWGKPVEFLETSQGNKLLVSGFWGWSRHFNYVGDLLMAWSWSLPCGFASPLPYYYPIYFTILLVHRERRDHDFCRRKYGADWDRYCDRVPWRILPGVY